MFTKNSKLKDVMKNPFGADTIEQIIAPLKINRLLVDNVVTRQIKLKNLVSLSRGKIDEELIEWLIDKMNKFDDLVLPKDAEEIKHTWWKEAIAYQIYPRSFKDSNDDGIGDLGGIIQKLDYLQELGVNLLWLSPIYDSPNDDNGYDIRNYKKIMKEFGTMEEFDKLLEEAHRRSIRLIMDLVINHTSDEHEWFVESQKSKDNPYRKYYIWEAGKDGKEPNNWSSCFSEPAWNYYKDSDEWCMHLFSRKQMDLNWEHEPMRKDLYKMINWWLDKGIDGFRLDVINFIGKPNGLPDGNSIVGELMGVNGAEHFASDCKAHNYLHEMNRETFGRGDFVTIGETPGIGFHTSKYYTHEKRKELDMIFNFEHIDNPGHNQYEDYEFDLNVLKKQFLQWQLEYGNSCWNSLFFDNHDYPRMISKVKKEVKYREVLGKLLGTFLLTLKGTPFIFQGQEIGMNNVDFNSIEDYRDIESINLYTKLIKEGKSKIDALDTIKAGSRDHARVPVQWSSENYAGFSNVRPWIDVSEDYKINNVEAQLKDTNSVYHFYKKLIRLRKEYKTLVYGEFIPYKAGKKNRFAYYRKDKNYTFYVEMNLSSNKQKRLMNKIDGKMILSNYKEQSMALLEPYEVDIYLVN